MRSGTKKIITVILLSTISVSSYAESKKLIYTDLVTGEKVEWIGEVKEGSKSKSDKNVFISNGKKVTVEVADDQS